MTAFELAAQLGKALKEDEKLVRLANAKKAYEEDKELQKYMIEYEVQQKALQVEITREERDTLFIDVIQKRIDELYKLIMEHPVFAELNEAQAEVNELMNAINNTISFEITGELPSSCTHNCSTCGGSCSH
ncbi:MAG: YlbF family regulator [Clostridia bacterium]|nr:YlbF family regulator [Clostridia bacterium]